MRKAHFVFAPPEIMRISPGFTLKAEKERMALQDQALEERYLNDLRKAGLSEELAIRRGRVLERKLSAILCADVFGYSRLMGDDAAHPLVLP